MKFGFLFFNERRDSWTASDDGKDLNLNSGSIQFFKMVGRLGTSFLAQPPNNSSVSWFLLLPFAAIIAGSRPLLGLRMDSILYPALRGR
jgi:hypothetical protein